MIIPMKTPTRMRTAVMMRMKTTTTIIMGPGPSEREYGPML
jgi:hypothetical protein